MPRASSWRRLRLHPECRNAPQLLWQLLPVLMKHPAGACHQAHIFQVSPDLTAISHTLAKIQQCLTASPCHLCCTPYHQMGQQHLRPVIRLPPDLLPEASSPKQLIRSRLPSSRCFQVQAHTSLYMKDTPMTLSVVWPVQLVSPQILCREDSNTVILLRKEQPEINANLW